MKETPDVETYMFKGKVYTPDMIRWAAKLMLFTRNGELIILKSNTRWSLIGGGIDAGETREDSLKREGREELALSLDNVVGLREVGKVEGAVTSKGRDMLARWSIFIGLHIGEISDLSVDGKEIKGFQVASREDCLAIPNMSDLAKEAIGNAMMPMSELFPSLPIGSLPLPTPIDKA
jgi:8-oxo-dGTP pyrophosphatase MutT (NUDIX family)